MRVVVLDDYQQVAHRCARWEDLGDEVDVTFVPEHLEGDALLSVLSGAEVVVAMRERTALSAAVLEGLPDLRLIVTTGLANVAIDVAAAHLRGVTVCGTNSLASPTAELTWGLIIGLMRQIPAEDAALRAGDWQTRLGQELSGKILGVIGLGRLGRRVAKVGLAFEMEVIAWSTNLDPEVAAQQGVQAVSKEELLARSDVVSLHLKLSERSLGTLGEAELRAMKPTAYLVNTARAGLVDPVALQRALTDGWIAGAALDVFEDEPLPAGDPWRKMAHTILTPHVGYVVEGGYDIFYGEAVEDIVAWRSGRPVRVMGPAT